MEYRETSNDSYQTENGTEIHQGDLTMTLKEYAESASGMPSGSARLEVRGDLLTLSGPSSSPAKPFQYCGLALDWWGKGVVVTLPGAWSRDFAYRDGSWKVEAGGSLIVSRDKGEGVLENYGKPLGMFRYLTGSDLISIVPPSGAIQDPAYYPVGLIR